MDFLCKSKLSFRFQSSWSALKDQCCTHEVSADIIISCEPVCECSTEHVMYDAFQNRAYR